jgi:hypothetical protein
VRRVELASPYGALQRDAPGFALVIRNGTRGRTTDLVDEMSVVRHRVIFDGVDGVYVNVPTHWLKEVTDAGG